MCVESQGEQIKRVREKQQSVVGIGMRRNRSYFVIAFAIDFKTNLQVGSLTPKRKTQFVSLQTVQCFYNSRRGD